ncbi:bcl-2-binding component 3 [Stegastes partitus]|uniref:Bcl-2-binding component 3 n=1 Tax=Stegastes partitus TaxID=144197 RepID=A0A9Y4KPX7_9TELE|nr:PREDICTED: SKI family transcriptional corepressor 2-like [Stegastes partitus]
MARAETIESVAETGGGANGPLPNTCRMELPHSLHTWPGLHLHHNHHHLPTWQAPYPSYPLPYPDPQGQNQPRTHQQLPALSPSATPPPSSPLCSRRDERNRGTVAPSDISGEQSDSDREDRLQASSRQGPPPDLLPQNEHPSWASPQHRAPRGEAVQELELRRVANQLRAIGDEFNATVLRRVHVAPHWQDWRDVCRGLVNFIAQTLSTLYRLT